MRPADILTTAIDTLNRRGTEYDSPQGECTIYQAVTAFNALSGRDLQLHEGALFMALVKAGRALQSPTNPDHYIDGAAYFGLAGTVAVPDDSAAKHVTATATPVGPVEGVGTDPSPSELLRRLHGRNEPVPYAQAFDAIWAAYNDDPSLHPEPGAHGYTISYSGSDSPEAVRIRAGAVGKLNRLLPVYRTREQADQVRASNEPQLYALLDALHPVEAEGYYAQHDGGPISIWGAYENSRSKRAWLLPLFPTYIEAIAHAASIDLDQLRRVFRHS